MTRKENNKNRNLIAAALISCGFLLYGCGSQAMDGLGIGAGVGGGIGYIIGNELDKINIWDAINQ